MACVVLALIAAGWLVMGVVEITNVHAERLVMGIGSAVLMGAYAAALGVFARALWRCQGWARGPVVATQLIQLPVAYSFLGGETVAIGIVFGLASAAVLIGVLSPSATRALVPPTD